MSQDEQARDQLYLLDPTDNKTVQLTAEPLGVFDYEPSPDGALVAYAAIREDGGNDLWIVAIVDQARYPLLRCPDAVCNGVAWRPDGARLVYERRNMLVAGTAPGPPRLWWLEPATGETAPVFEDTQIIGYGAGWSPDGQWLSYLAPASQGVQLYNVVDGRAFLIPSRMNDLPAWSPRENVLIVTDIQAREEGFAVHLLRARPDSGELVDLSGVDQMVEDSSAAWSADGEWIIFARKAAGAAMGKQLWLMRADGTEARYLTTDSNIHHAFPGWSPDGRSVTFQSLPLKELGARPSIWLLEVETGQTRQLARAAGRPLWLP
jgi:TolB protein